MCVCVCKRKEASSFCESSQVYIRLNSLSRALYLLLPFFTKCPFFFFFPSPPPTPGGQATKGRWGNLRRLGTPTPTNQPPYLAKSLICAGALGSGFSSKPVATPSLSEGGSASKLPFLKTRSWLPGGRRKNERRGQRPGECRAQKKQELRRAVQTF